MDNTIGLLDVLRKIIVKRRCAINISKTDSEVMVSIKTPFRRKHFKSEDSDLIILKIRNYYQV